MTAFGMGDRTYAKGLMTKALQGGTANGSLATTLNDSKILAFVKTFTSVSSGKSDTATMIASVVAKYHEVALEANQEKQSPGVALALYFQQNAPTVTDVYGLLADKKLLTVVQTALSISPLTGLEDLGTQANYLSKKINVADFKDPAKLQTFLTRFSALYDSERRLRQPAEQRASRRQQEPKRHRQYDERAAVERQRQLCVEQRQRDERAALRQFRHGQLRSRRDPPVVDAGLQRRHLSRRCLRPTSLGKAKLASSPCAFCGKGAGGNLLLPPRCPI